MDKIIHNSPYGDSPFNFHATKTGNTLSIDVTYPAYEEAESVKKGNIYHVRINQESVRASDGIRVHYDFKRDGFAIEQASIFEWDVSDNVCDEGWKEVAFIPSWGQQSDEKS